MNETRTREGWRELLHDSARRWQLLSTVTCLSILFFRVWGLLELLWSGHALLICRETSSRTIKVVSAVIAAGLLLMSVWNLYVVLSSFL